MMQPGRTMALRCLVALAWCATIGWVAAGCERQEEATADTAGTVADRAEGEEADESASPTVNTAAVAEKVVIATADVGEGDVVLIEGSPRDITLLEDLAIQVRKVGGFPLVTITTDRLQRQLYDQVPAQYDSQQPTSELRMVEMIDVYITVEPSEDPAVLEGVPQERIEARSKVGAQVLQASRAKGVRFVSVGNGLYPTDENATAQGMSTDELAGLFWPGVGADPTEMTRRGEALRRALESGREVRLTNPNGTDLTFRIEGRPVFVSDGVISEEDRQRGGAATSVWLPAGEVYLAPVPGTANGTLVVDRDRFRGKDIRGLKLTFENGKVTSMTADSGLEPFQQMYDASGAGKDEFAYFDIGINPSIRPPEGKTLNAYMPAGMVTVGIGNNTWAGGENQSSVGTAYFLPGSTVEVDGNVVVEDGELALQTVEESTA